MSTFQNNTLVSLELLKKHVDVNHADKNRRTALIIATQKNNTALMERLIERGANPHLKDIDDRTALDFVEANDDIAVKMRNILIEGTKKWDADHTFHEHTYAVLLSTMLRAPVDTEFFDIFLKRANLDMINSKTDKSLLMKAAAQGNTAAVKFLIEKNVDVNMANSKKETALMVAVRQNHLSVIDVLLKHGAFVHALDDQEDTAWNIAMKEGHFEAVRLLMNHGAYFNLLRANDKCACLSVKWYGAYCDEVRGVVYERWSDVSEENPTPDTSSIEPKLGQSILELAAAKDHFSMVDFLIDNVAYKKISKVWAEKALIIALKKNDTSRVSDILDKRDVDLNAKDEDGKTVYEIASGSKNLDIDYLMLLKAATVNQPSIVHHFIEKVADEKLSKVWALKALLAASRSNISGPVIDMLVKLHEVDINAADENGSTALMIAQKSQNLKALFQLTSYGARPKQDDNHTS